MTTESKINLKEALINFKCSARNFFQFSKRQNLTDDLIDYKTNLRLNQEYKNTLYNEELLRPNKYNEKLSFRKGFYVDQNASRIPQLAEKGESVEETPALLNKKTDRSNKLYEKSQVEAKEANTALATYEDKVLLNKIPEKYKIKETSENVDNLVLSLYRNENHITFRKNKLVTPDWHAPWKLYRVISGHTHWVRCIDVDPTNNWYLFFNIFRFVTGSNDKMIKFWDLASGKLKLSLTGHINTIRGLAISPRHPYLFSCGEDKMVLCWDLEQNKIVRSYHGHLSGCHSISLHPTLDIITTAGRDCVARVWDIRTKQQIFCLEGHNNTIGSVVSQEFEPQIITGSHDNTIKTWDLGTGKCLETLTHHKKSIRSLAIHPDDYTFVSGAADNLKVWKCPEGRFMRNISGHNTIIHTVAINRDGVLASGGDNGTIYMWDYKSGYNFQKIETVVQPGSLSSENAIFDIKFDQSSTRMITAECDKTIKMWKPDENADEENFPVKSF